MDRKSIREQMQELFPHETPSVAVMAEMATGTTEIDQEPLSLDDMVAIAQSHFLPKQYTADSEDDDSTEWSSIDHFVQRSFNLGDPLNLIIRKEEEQDAPIAVCADTTVTTVITRPWFISAANHTEGSSDVRKLRNTNARCLGEPSDPSFDERLEIERAQCVKRFIEQGLRDEEYREARKRMDRMVP